MNIGGERRTRFVALRMGIICVVVDVVLCEDVFRSNNRPNFPISKG